ncbi:MAG: hypothetical protein Edafosvirus2_38 [Edafosvirus sp.]|uniref:Uncharacterized protein n=1 Tax=Edafosvirus sp. TaxID=2487765 RepID=A0A3G4ZWR6_9VIRU|nr:MAG: hypothetical protein Edafosvirus2_38 [Edafosvirus sp.]
MCSTVIGPSIDFLRWITSKWLVDKVEYEKTRDLITKSIIRIEEGVDALRTRELKAAREHLKIALESIQTDKHFKLSKIETKVDHDTILVPTSEYKVPDIIWEDFKSARNLAIIAFDSVASGKEKLLAMRIVITASIYLFANNIDILTTNINSMLERLSKVESIRNTFKKYYDDSWTLWKDERTQFVLEMRDYIASLLQMTKLNLNKTTTRFMYCNTINIKANKMVVDGMDIILIDKSDKLIQIGENKEDKTWVLGEEIICRTASGLRKKNGFMCVDLKINKEDEIFHMWPIGSFSEDSKTGDSPLFNIKDKDTKFLPVSHNTIIQIHPLPWLFLLPRSIMTRFVQNEGKWNTEKIQTNFSAFGGGYYPIDHNRIVDVIIGNNSKLYILDFYYISNCPHTSLYELNDMNDGLFYSKFLCSFDGWHDDMCQLKTSEIIISGVSDIKKITLGDTIEVDIIYTTSNYIKNILLCKNDSILVCSLDCVVMLHKTNYGEYNTEIICSTGGKFYRADQLTDGRVVTIDNDGIIKVWGFA